MTSRDFVFWLQGFFEIAGANPTVDTAYDLSAPQTDIIKKHLALVFIHEIDPSAGPKPHQANLNAIHNVQSPPSDGVTYRC